MVGDRSREPDEELVPGRISIPNLGVGIQGIGPLLNPQPIVGALSPLLHSGLLSGSYAGEGMWERWRRPAGPAPSAPCRYRRTGRRPSRRSGRLRPRWTRLPLDAAPEMASIGQTGMFGQTALSSLAGRAIGGTATRAAVGQGYRVPGAVATDDIATTATIIVIPPSAE